MKRSRIICSIVTVIYIILSAALVLILAKSVSDTESSISVNVRALHIGMFGICTFMYIFVKNKLAKKMSNKHLSVIITRIYRYLYLAVIVLVSRLIMAYVLKDSALNTIVPTIDKGFLSYLNYGLGTYIGNQIYANIVINTIFIFIACILIKRLMLNITDNDTIATITSIIYILLPKSLMYITEYVRYNWNVIATLFGMIIFVKIVDEVKKFDKNNNKYLIYSLIFGIIQSLDVLFGGQYLMWVAMLLFVILAAMYVDVLHIRLRFNSSSNYKLKRFLEKIEKTNISKFICVAVISLTISLFATIIRISLFDINNYQTFSITGSLKVLMNSRNYYLLLIISSLIAEIIGVILKRKLDIKMFGIKVAFLATSLITFFIKYDVYVSAVFDTLLILTTIINICNICYNREEKVKLLKSKN